MLTSKQKLSPSSGRPALLLSIRLVILTQFLAAHQLPPDAAQTLPETNSTKPLDSIAGALPQNNTRRSGTATVNQICSTQRARNSSLCRPCRCNLNGSKSAHCDTYTRRCSCLLGYSGSTCNKCSPGYHNKPAANLSNQSLSNAIASIDQNPLEEPSISSVYCVPCDGCYLDWRQLTSELKESAVRLVERAHKLDQNYVNQIGVAVLANDTSLRLPIENNRIMLSDIDQVVSKLGEQMLDNKQKSDRLNLLSGELKLINDSFEPHQSTLQALNIQLSDLDVNLVRLQNELELKSVFVGNVSSRVAEFRHELNNVQEQNPFVVPRLIGRNRARTSKALTDIREMDQFSPLILTIGELDHKREKIESSRRQLDIIGANILANYIGYQIQNDSTARKGVRYSSHDLESLSNSTSNLQSKTNSIMRLLLNHFDDYRSKYEMRLGAVEGIRSDIALTNTSLVSSEWLLINERVSDQLSSDLIGTLINIDQLLNNSIKSNRASLDKIDAKRSSAQDELSDLKLKLAQLTDSNTTLNNTALEMEKTADNNLSKLANFLEAFPNSDLDELLTLETKLTNLDQVRLKLRQSLLHLGHLDGETSQKASQTGVLIADIHSMISDLSGQNSTEFGIALKLNDSSHEASNGVDLANTRMLVSRSQELLDRVQTYEVRQVGQGISSGRLIGTPTPVDLANTITLKPVSSKLQAKLDWLWRNLAELDKEGARNNSDLITIMTSDKRRLAQVKSSLKQLVLMLNEGLMMTYELADDLVEHGQDLADQRKKIDELHYQMDSITDDLESKFDFDDGCSVAR